MLDARWLRNRKPAIGCAVFVLAVAAVVTGCSATSKPYTPAQAAPAIAAPPEQAPELATIVGAAALRDVAWEFVEIWKVDGDKRSSRQVTLSPGVHVITARYDTMPRLAIVLRGEFGQDVGLPIVVDDAQHFVATGSTRTLRLNVEPGCTYALYANRSPVEYYVSRHPNDPTFVPEWDPPWEAIRCVTPAEGADLTCDFPRPVTSAGATQP